MKNRRIIYIGGGERTGTTLLQRVFCTDPSYVPVVGEAHIFGDIVRLSTQARDRYDFFYSDYFSAVTVIENLYQQLYSNLIDNIFEKYDGFNSIALKAPAFTKVLPEMLRFTPSAHAIVMLRNPWDAVASLCNVGKKSNRDSLAKVGNLANNPVAATERFLSMYTRVMSEGSRNTQDIYFLKYEDLVTKPAEVISSLSNRFEGSFTIPGDTDTSLNSIYLSERRDSRHSGYWSDNYRKAIVPTSVDVYHQQFSEEQIVQIGKVAADYIHWAGYEDLLA